MNLKQLTQALADANVAFSIDGEDGKEVYIDDSLILYCGSAYVEPVDDPRFFHTSPLSSIPLKELKLKDIQSMIQHYRKFHPALPEISSSEV
jgi:hypothetical protein